MVSAKILKGRRATAVWNIQIDLENAGATVLDEPCVVDGNLITGALPLRPAAADSRNGEAAHGGRVAGVGRRQRGARAQTGTGAGGGRSPPLPT